MIISDDRSDHLSSPTAALGRAADADTASDSATNANASTCVSLRMCLCFVSFLLHLNRFIH
jgi:hypothetical protein